MLAAPIDLTKLSLTVVAGVGGVVALVVAYRRQRDLEQGRFVERFGAAAAQLGSTDVAVRIAGAYAMAGVADESRGLRRQQCIDVLCGYLRLPYNAEHGASGRAKFVVKAPRVDHGRVRGETEEHIEYRQNDSEVRKTIVSIIADHLRPTAEYSWSPSNFTFRGAYLEDVDFSHATFSGTVAFSGVTFSGFTTFTGATFSGDALFDDVTFSGNSAFERVTFSGFTTFTGATFSHTARFFDTIFSADAWFSHATFSDIAFFLDATFSGLTSFNGATFSGAVVFRGATFSRTTRFSHATFSDNALFNDATFSGHIVFEEVDFGTQSVSFADPRRWGPPEPEFDWSADITLKPANVEPHDWPPAVVTPVPSS
ncbi:pentapeptide repeat-containing protein [Nocardia jiangxiensis]|uniref:pentapeptide repeat-containing protein n=1 Tax=Nocardia jiangxiensis TaxID=282685 RepID=UPI00146C1E2C|nr:pentapeptide repeat-containing protein [Nocardia jiangxiensis]